MYILYVIYHIPTCRQKLDANAAEICPGSPYDRAVGISQMQLVRGERPHMLRRMRAAPDSPSMPVVSCTTCGAMGGRVFRLLLKPRRGEAATCGARAILQLTSFRSTVMTRSRSWRPSLITTSSMRFHGRLMRVSTSLSRTLMSASCWTSIKYKT